MYINGKLRPCIPDNKQINGSQKQFNATIKSTQEG